MSDYTEKYSNNNDEYDYELYILAELNYQKMHPGEVNIFPIDWYSMNDYKYKSEIIAEALNKHIDIEATELYQNRYENGKFIR